MEKKALYAFSGDPITYGHINIIARAARVFSTLYVAIGQNPQKNYTFGIAERTLMAQKVLAHLDNVIVVSFTGLLVDFAYEQGIHVIIKGVRNSTDFEYEHVLHQVGESQKVGVDTYVLFAEANLAHVSSSMVKAIQLEHGCIAEYVPPYIKQLLEQKISQQVIIGITGEIAVGKSFLCNKLQEIGAKLKQQVHHIELDHLAHDILQKLVEPIHIATRDKIATTFGATVMNNAGFINRTALGNLVFGSAAKMQQLNNIMRQPLLLSIKRVIYNKPGIILINAALLAEFSMAYLSNNNVILVSSSTSLQKTRLRQRKLSSEQITKRLASQYTTQQKLNALQQQIARDNYGTIWQLENNDKIDLTVWFKTVLENLPI
ncbi:MAG: hypothetical protein COC15_01975 [Legionellales bacterium]|nr:MAG: hypothetical protein COC15_01975 [Legionellales bacterium]